MCIEEKRGRVVVDFSRCDRRQLSGASEEFGVLCAGGKVRAALLKTAHEPADVHYALRDVLTTVARVAGVPLRFRLAVVTGSESIEETYRSIQSELRPLGCEVRMFRAAHDAERWLRHDRRARAGAAADEITMP